MRRETLNRIEAARGVASRLRADGSNFEAQKILDLCNSAHALQRVASEYCIQNACLRSLLSDALAKLTLDRSASTLIKRIERVL